MNKMTLAEFLFRCIESSVKSFEECIDDLKKATSDEKDVDSDIEQ